MTIASYCLASEQISSRLRASEDYDKHNAWDRGVEGTKEELIKLYPNAEFLKARVVDKAKVYNGVLQGRSRWTPKGFMQKNINAHEVESPTAQENSNYTTELMGLLNLL